MRVRSTGANHGFHNDTTPRYDESAATGLDRTLDWSNKYLRSVAGAIAHLQRILVSHQPGA